MRFASKVGSAGACGTAGARGRAGARGTAGQALLAGVLWMGAALGACGGSTSETPWPAEPIDLEPGPAGEARQNGNVIDTQTLPDNYTKRGEGGGEPITDEDPDPEEGPLGPEALPESDE